MLGVVPRRPRQGGIGHGKTKRILPSSPSFTRAANAPGRVQQMRTSGQPLYMMRVSSGLRLIYTTVGDTVYVVDLVEGAMLNHFAASKNAKKATTALAKKRVPKATAQKASDLVEVWSQATSSP
jgi:hypothetical protein